MLTARFLFIMKRPAEARHYRTHWRRYVLRKPTTQPHEIDSGRYSPSVKTIPQTQPKPEERNILFNIILLAGNADGFVSRGDTFGSNTTSRKGNSFLDRQKARTSTNTSRPTYRSPLPDESVKEIPPRLRYPLRGTIRLRPYVRRNAIHEYRRGREVFTANGGRQRRGDTLGQFLHSAGAVGGRSQTVKRTEKIPTKPGIAGSFRSRENDLSGRCTPQRLFHRI